MSPHVAIPFSLRPESLAPLVMTMLALGLLWLGSGVVLNAASPVRDAQPLVVASGRAPADSYGRFDFVVAPLRKLAPSQVTTVVYPTSEPAS
jgi:hypothetical protein